MGKRIERITVELPVGLEGVCGQPTRCAIANELKNMGYLRPKVGVGTIAFVDPATDERITIETPTDAVQFILAFDRSNEPGGRETVTPELSGSFQLPLGGKTVTRKPVQRMSQEDKDRINETRQARLVTDPEFLSVENVRRRTGEKVAKARAS